MRCASGVLKRFPSSRGRRASPSPAAASSIRLSLADYRAHGGWRGLERARSLGPAATVEEVTKSGLRGRGGAGFPTGIKWKTVADTAADRKYIVCNADEGDSGTYADRMIMEGDPFVLIEGMAIAGFAVGATKGYIYIRSEYPDAIRVMERAIVLAEREGLLGAEAKFDLEVRVGAGAYVCGEETSLLESLEGKRGQVRAKPPLPAHKGLFGKPTVINNLISLATVPAILADGAEHYAALGMGRSRGTMPIQLAGNAKHGGLFEAAFGLTLGEIVEDIGGGTKSGRPARAVQVGGPLGAYFPRKLFDTPFDYEAFAALDGLIGHGGVVVFDDTRRHGAPGALRAGVLRHRILRQVHALPHRLGARHRDHGQDHPRRARRGQPRAGHRSLPDAEVRLALCAGRLHALSGDERHPAFPRGFQPPAPAGCGGIRSRPCLSFTRPITARQPASRPRW